MFTMSLCLSLYIIPILILSLLIHPLIKHLFIHFVPLIYQVLIVNDCPFDVSTNVGYELLEILLFQVVVFYRRVFWFLPFYFDDANFFAIFRVFCFDQRYFPIQAIQMLVELWHVVPALQLPTNWHRLVALISIHSRVKSFDLHCLFKAVFDLALAILIGYQHRRWHLSFFPAYDNRFSFRAARARAVPWLQGLHLSASLIKQVASARPRALCQILKIAVPWLPRVLHFCPSLFPNIS